METPEAIATREFAFLDWRNPNHLTSMLPLCLYLKHHERGTTTKSGTANNVIGWVHAWLAESVYAQVVVLDASANTIEYILSTLLEGHKDYFGLGKTGMHKRATVYSIESCEWGATYFKLLNSLPLHWSVTRLPDSSTVFSRDDLGATKTVTVAKPDLGGHGTVRSITFNGISVMSSIVGGRICNQQDLEVVLSRVAYFYACVGVSEQTVSDDDALPKGSTDVFLSMVRQTERTVDSRAGLTAGDRWANARVRGLLAGTGGVSGVLGLVGGRDVLWSKDCAAAASTHGSTIKGWVPRCSECKKFWRTTVKPKINKFLEPAQNNATHADSSTAQEVAKLGNASCHHPQEVAGVPEPSYVHGSPVGKTDNNHP